MTDREKAIVMAYTGISMLTGEKIDEFYKYLAELYGRPVYTHEIVILDIQEKAKPDFVELCRTEQPSAHRKKCKWIPVPNTRLVTCECGFTTDRLCKYNFCPDCGAEMVKGEP
jgi:hypothetical protein